ncbi:hypothetical protein PanWU01x14_186740, partial [Parasponia andersonii]
HEHLTAAPSQGTGREPIRNPSDEASMNRGGIGGGAAESGDEIGDLAGDGGVVEGGEDGDERGDKEERVEGEEGAEEGGLGEGDGELRESVGDVESRGVRVGDEVGEAEEANGAALLGVEDQRGPVALRAR